MLCCCVQSIEIYIEQNSIKFMFPFEDNCYRIISITSRSLWWTWFIASYVWTMIMAFQKWWLRHNTIRKTRNIENRQKIRRYGIASTIGQRWFANQKQLVEQLDGSQKAVSNRLRDMGRFRRPVDVYHLSWTTGKSKSAKTHVTFCSLGTKESRFWIVSYSIVQGMKREFILRIPSAKCHG